jgi:preprotein translocase subunit SecG
METFVICIHILVALFMILVVLVQGGNQGGVGAAFGGGNSQSFFGATGAVTLLGKLTYGAAAIFMVTSITLTILQGGTNVGLSKKLRERSAHSEEAPQTPKAPEQPAAAPQPEAK